MYMRPRGPLVRPRPSMRPDYEDFQPMSSWTQEEGSDVLLVLLPGFVREQVKVSVETSSTVKVIGQRPLGNNRWSRFNREFNIPEDCNVSALSAKFENGTLFVTMPKKIASPQVGLEEKEVEAKTTQDTPLTPPKAAAENIAQIPSPQKAAVEPKPQKGQEELPPKATLMMTGIEKQRDDKSTAGPPSPQKAAVELKSQKGEEELPPKASSTMAGIEKQRDDKSAGSPSTQTAATELKSQKGQEELPAKATSTVGTDGEKPTDKEGVKAPISPQKLVSEPKAQKGEGKSTSLEATSPASTSKQTDGKIVGSNSAEDGFNLEKCMKVLKDLPMKIREERQSVMNIGAAFAVIVALGAYISYFGPSGKARN